MDTNEKYKNARAIIVLLAAFITHMLNLKYERDLLTSLLILLFVIVIFTLISSLAIKLFDKITKMDNSKKLIDETIDSQEQDDDSKQ